MKRTTVLVACALAAVLTLSVMPSSVKVGPFGVDMVSAASEETSTTTPTTSTSTKTTTTTNTTTKSSSTSSTSSTIAGTLRLGSKGSNVRALQTFLNNNGYKLKVDGDFGKSTLAAVKDFQAKNGLKADGIVAQNTRAKMNAVVAAAVPVTTTTTAAPTLRLGSKGDAVKSLQINLNNNGYKLKVDGIFGNGTLSAVKSYQKAKGLSADGIVGPKTYAKLTPAPAPVAVAEKASIKIGKAEYAAHGTKCFTVAVVAMAGDKIAAAYIDDYQFMAKATSVAVPNSDKDFGTANYKDATKVLASKRLNADAYTNSMKTNGGATLTVDQNFGAIQEFVKGKTIAQLEEIRKSNSTDPKVDAVSGATLADTNGYLDAVISAAKASNKNSAFEVAVAEVSSIKVGKVEYAAHGTKCYTLASVVMLGDKIVGAYLDDYQFMAKATSVAVPNSDKDFGTANYKDATKVLASKRLNAEAYTNTMKTNGGATLTVDQNFGAIEAFVTGKTIAQLEEIAKTNGTDPKVDAVTSATLADTTGYLNAFVAAAKAVK